MFNRLRTAVKMVVLVGTLVLGVGSWARAADFDAWLVPNTFNTFEDNSREAFIDANNDNVFGVGDVIVGFVRIEDRSAPSTVSLGNTTYAIFSQQVTALSGSVVNFGATTVSGLQMSDLVSGASSSAMIALVSNNSGFSTDLILNAPSNQTGTSAVTMADYIKFLTNNGTLQLTAGIVNPTNSLAGDFFTALLQSGAPSTATIATAPSSLTFALFSAGLSILQNNTSFKFIDDVLTNGAGGYLTDAQLAIVGGNVRGTGGTSPANFLDASELTALIQCLVSGVNTPCGFIDNADFVVHPVPEPASMILFGFGLAALGMYGRRSRNRQKSE